MRLINSLFQLYRSSKPYFFTFLTSGSPSSSCRYLPTCNSYCHQAIIKHGYLRGGYLCFRRLLRCHPFSSHPRFDPVP